MAKTPQGQSFEENLDRQYEIDQITERYEREYRAGKSPQIADYLQRYPEYARELLEFAFFFHTFETDEPQLTPSPATQLSPAAERVLKRIYLEGLVKQGRSLGYKPAQLAEAVGLSLDILAKLDGRTILANTIPNTLIQRLAAVLQVIPEAVQAYFKMAPRAASATFSYADEAPQELQEAFAEAVRTSSILDAQKKGEWIEIIKQDHPET